MAVDLKAALGSGMKNCGNCRHWRKLWKFAGVCMFGRVYVGIQRVALCYQGGDKPCRLWEKCEEEHDG